MYVNLYFSEEKANLLRKVGGDIEEKDAVLTYVPVNHMFCRMKIKYVFNMSFGYF